MNRKAIALLLTILLAGTTVALADEKEKKGKKQERDDERQRVERQERDNDDERDVRRTVVVVPTNRIVRINTDVNRLESLLATAQNSSVSIPQPTLTRVANEANALANRIYARTRNIGRANAAATARALRMHVREMHKAAASGDIAGVRLHAGQALSFAVKLDGLV